jgi:protein O-GlcNAc transferase
MVTMPLETLASRVASSQLHALGCPELVAKSKEDYVKIASRLGTDKELCGLRTDFKLNLFLYFSLNQTRAKVWKARTTSTLFDVLQYCSDFENLLHRIWRRYEDGLLTILKVIF